METGYGRSGVKTQMEGLAEVFGEKFGGLRGGSVQTGNGRISHEAEREKKGARMHGHDN